MSDTSDSDETLLGRHARGDAVAFELLYRRHEMRTWRYLERSAGNRASADELMQTLWCAVAKDAARFQSTVRFATWLFSIAYTRISDSARAAPAAWEQATVIMRALGQLSLERRGAFLLQMEGDLSIEEIAAITNSSLDGIEGHLRQARVDLRELLREVTSGQNQRVDVEDVDDRYRSVSAADLSQPSEWVRCKVLAHAAQLAAERASSARTRDNSGQRPPEPGFENRTWRQPVIWGALGAAVLGGLYASRHLLTDADAGPGVTISAATAGTLGGASGVEDTSKTAVSPLSSRSALWRAAEAGDVPGLRTAFTGRVDINSRNADGRTALMLAVRQGQANAVRELLAHGADPNVPDGYGTTPLHAATAAGNSSIIVVLKQAGAR